MDNKQLVRELANAAMAAGKPQEWFETLYAQAAGDASLIPWAKMRANPNLSPWLKRQPLPRKGTRALVVGCGLGDDAQALSDIGYAVDAFDLSPTCIAWCKQRFPNSPVRCRSADLLRPPSQWQKAFQFVFEANTLQTLPQALRPTALKQLAAFVSVGGALLVVARGRDAADEEGQMPWPLLRSELDWLGDEGLSELQFEDFVEQTEASVRRFRVHYQREVGAQGDPT